MSLVRVCMYRCIWSTRTRYYGRNRNGKAGHRCAECMSPPPIITPSPLGISDRETRHVEWCVLHLTRRCRFGTFATQVLLSRADVNTIQRRNVCIAVVGGRTRTTQYSRTLYSAHTRYSVDPLPHRNISASAASCRPCTPRFAAIIGAHVRNYSVPEDSYSVRSYGVGVPTEYITKYCNRPASWAVGIRDYYDYRVHLPTNLFVPTRTP